MPEIAYKKLANRCPGCGHRRLMHDVGGCHVEMGEGMKMNPKRCSCRIKKFGS